jgi:integrase
MATSVARHPHATRGQPDGDRHANVLQAPTPRARILTNVLAHTGLRISEALSLRWVDWDGAAKRHGEARRRGWERPGAGSGLTPTVDTKDISGS